MNHAHDDEPLWTAEEVAARLSAAQAAVRAAHQATGYPCVPCPACLAWVDTTFQFSTQFTRQYEDLDRRWHQNLQTIEEHSRRLTAIEVLREQYAALKEAHDALQLEYEDLQTAYYVTQQTLRRRQGEGP